jgi:hypothetical protein
MGEDLEAAHVRLPPRQRPGEWLEYNPLLTLIVVVKADQYLWLIVVVGAGVGLHELASSLKRLRDRLLFAVLAATGLFSGGSAVCSRVIL